MIIWACSGFLVISASTEMKKTSPSVRTHLKDVLRKDAIYDEEFKTAELTRVNDDARMFFDVLRSYVGAMPSAEYSLNVVFVNPPELRRLFLLFLNMLEIFGKRMLI